MPKGKKTVKLKGEFPTKGPWTHVAVDVDGNVSLGNGGMWAVDDWISRFAKDRDRSSYEIQVTAPAEWFKMEEEDL